MKSYIVTEKAGRIVANAVNNGVGTRLLLDEDQAAAAVEAGQLVPDTEADEGDEAEVPASDLAEMTKADLVALAETRGVTLPDRASKAQIIEALKAAAAAGTQTP